ncbi:ATP-binding protein [Rhizobacter sp. J219]|uniref:sensor histidine kinase n=1 Tax=Rhizobacter sp. J219 TaxID=2898430 RepID=UPI00215108A3|nr:ATP-binding protein [Rhizobacter sp. J219]MCR5883251.1 ATP-binding protein [Rhizobacter sp. J219]
MTSVLLSVLALLALVAAAAAVGWSVKGQQRQRQLERELQAARAREHALIQSLGHWHWRTDLQHRVTLLRPPSSALATDWPPVMKDLESHPLLWDVFQSNDGSLKPRLLSHAAFDGVAATLAGHPGLLLRGAPVLDADGHYAGHVGTASEAVAASAPTGPSPQDLQDQESFSYTVSHDLRAPIRVVEGFTKILKEDYGRLLDRIGNDHLDRVLGAAARMNSMIDALLALSQLSTRPLTRQPVNLSQLIGYIVDDLRRQSPERQVTVIVEPDLQVQGDATLLRVALENLLGNAWKYTAKCREPRIWVERTEHEGHPAFAIRDNGAGFDMRFADRLFGVFQRLHSATDFQGTGVGLASVRRIMRRHGGDIWAEGEVDRGARFVFWLGS